MWLTTDAVAFHFVKSCPALCNPMNCSRSGLYVLHYLPEFAQTHVYWVSDAIQPPYPLLPPSPPALTPPQHRGLFQWVSSSHQVAMYWSFNLSISPSNEYSGLISFRIDCFSLLAVQGTLKCLLQHHSSKASILWCSDFFMVQLSESIHDYWKSHSFGYSFDYMQTFLCKVMSLLFNTLSRFVIAFPPRSKHLLISWLQSLSTVILESQK